MFVFAYDSSFFCLAQASISTANASAKRTPQTLAQATNVAEHHFILLFLLLSLSVSFSALTLGMLLLLSTFSILRMQACAFECLVLRVSSSRGQLLLLLLDVYPKMNSRDRQFWTEFLELYRSLPAVWKVKSPEYSSRALKSAGYEQLVLKLREVEPDADRAVVVKKINSFRTNFRRDLRKRDQSSEEEPFESTLWYFELLSFLEGQEESSSCQILQKVNNPEHEVLPEALVINLSFCSSCL